MMGKVIAFPEKNDPHATGTAHCIQCSHEWEAVAPIGTVQLECPECHTMKGLFKLPFAPDVGEHFWKCNCGNDLFYLTPKGSLCTNCGIFQVYD